MTHSSTCTGCPRCNTVFAALAAAPPREQAQFNLARVNAQRIANAAPTVAAAAVPPIEAPEPPNLVAAINARRTTLQKGIPVGTVPEPVFLNGYGSRRPQPPTVNAHGGIDDPPSLTEEISRRRTR